MLNIYHVCFIFILVFSVVGGRINVEPDTLEEQVTLRNLSNPTEMTDSSLNVCRQLEDIPDVPEVQCLQEKTVLETKTTKPQMTLLL